MAKKRKILKIAFSVVTFVCVIMSMITPAMAVVLDNELTHIGSLMKGTCTLTLVDTPDVVANYATDVSFTFGGRLPWMEYGGTNDKLISYQMWLPFEDGWSYTSNVNMARRNTPVTITTGGTLIYEFDSYRYNVSSYIQPAGDSNITAYYSSAHFDFEPYYLPIVDRAILEKLFVLRLTSTSQVTCSVTYSWLGLDKEVHTDTSIRYGSFAVGGSEVVGGILPKCIDDIIADVGVDPGGAGLFIEDLEITVNPSGGTYKDTGVIFDMLCDVWLSAVPQFYFDNPTQVWLQNVYKYIEGSGDDSPLDPGVGAQFTSFLAGAVSGFFDVEIMPGFSLGGVMAAIIAVVVTLLLLKFFSGG